MLRLRNALRAAWGLYCWLLFACLLSVAVLAAVLLPTTRLRRAASRRMARLFFALSGLSLSLAGEDRLPAGACVVVANHASYLDGPLLYAALPPVAMTWFSQVIPRRTSSSMLLKTIYPSLSTIS